MHDNRHLKNLVIKGVGWLVIKRIFTQVILTTSNLILVRILFPADFGTFVIIQFLVTIFWVFADLGLGRGLIQKKDEPDTTLLQSVWWTQTGLGFLVAGILWIVSPSLVSYYSGQLPMVSIEWIRILAVSQVLVNMSGVSAILLERRLNYKKIFIAETSGLFVTQASTIIFAILGYGTVSFVFGLLIGRVVALFVYFILSPWQWGFTISFSALKPLLSFGFSFQISIWLSIANGAVIPVFLGRFPGPGGWTGVQAVGFVAFAYGVAALCGAAGEIVNQFIFPLMSRLQEEKALAIKYFKRALWIVVFMTFGAASLLLALAQDLINIVYTPNWLSALPAFYLSLIQITLNALTAPALNTLLAFGDSRFYRNIHIFWTLIQWGLSIPLVLLFGFWGVVLAGVLVSTTGIFAFFRLNRYIQLSYMQLIRTPLILAMAVGIFVLVIVKLFPINNFFHFFSVFALGGAIYCFLVYLFMRREFNENLQIVKELVLALSHKRYRN